MCPIHNDLVHVGSYQCGQLTASGSLATLVDYLPNAIAYLFAHTRFAAAPRPPEQPKIT